MFVCVLFVSSTFCIVFNLRTGVTMNNKRRTPVRILSQSQTCRTLQKSVLIFSLNELIQRASDQISNFPLSGISSLDILGWQSNIKTSRPPYLALIKNVKNRKFVFQNLKIINSFVIFSLRLAMLYNINLISISHCCTHTFI